MTFLTSLLDDKHKAQNPYILLQSSSSQSALPILRAIINTQQKNDLILVCNLLNPTILLESENLNVNGHIRTFDWTAEVPGYCGPSIDWDSRRNTIKSAIEVSLKPVTLVFDSIDTLEEDYESPSKAYRFIATLLSALRARNDNSRLILHLTPSCSLLPSLTEPSFSPTLVHLTAQPCALLTHIAHAYLASPPSQLDPPPEDHARFWKVYAPFSERTRDIEKLVYGQGSDDTSSGSLGLGIGEGGPSSSDEFVVDIVVRARGGDTALPNSVAASEAIGTGTSRRRGVERLLEGWARPKGGQESWGRPVLLTELVTLRGVWRKQAVAPQEAPDPTKNLSFNLTLTESQQVSRAQVPLPYEHDGKQLNSNQGPQIFYDPDSADDLDEEDPDEDLDI